MGEKADESAPKITILPDANRDDMIDSEARWDAEESIRRSGHLPISDNDSFTRIKRLKKEKIEKILDPSSPQLTGDRLVGRRPAQRAPRRLPR